MEDIFGVEEGELKLMLRGLSSVGAHPLRCIWLLFVRFKSLGSIPCQSTAEEYKNQLTIQSIWYFHSLRFSAFSLFTVTDRTSSVTRVHTTQLAVGLFYRNFLADVFINSPNVGKEEIMTQTLMSFGPQVMELLGHLSLQCMLQVVCLEFFAKVFSFFGSVIWCYFLFTTSVQKSTNPCWLIYPILSYLTISGIIATSHFTAESAWESNLNTVWWVSKDDCL